jgi:hypothetical protein
MFLEKLKKIFSWEQILLSGLMTLIIIITLIHSQFFSFIDFKIFWIMDWNYEFTKTMIFNILLPFLGIIYWFIVFYYREKIELSKTLFFTIIASLWIVFTSTLFAEIFFHSLFWSDSKWHGLFFWSNLLILFLIFQYIYNQKKEKIIENWFIFSGFLISIVWIYEYIFPSFDYGELSNRLLSTLWHPNYVAFIFVLLVPLLFLRLKEAKDTSQKIIYFLLNILFLGSLLLTKSAIWIFLVLSFYYFQIWCLWKKLKFLFYIIWIFTWAWVILQFAPEKLSSFISRFYIWETTLKIIFSDLKIFLFWVWPDNLWLLFDIAKSPELYIFENYWFWADRPHNIFLNLWVHFWIFWFLLFLIVLKSLFPFHLEKWRHYSLGLWLIFLSFNFSSVLWYVLFIFILSWILYRKYKFSDTIPSSHIQWLLLIFLIIWFFWSYYSYKYMIWESANYKEDYSKALEFFPYKNINHYKNYKMYEWLEAENYFYSEQYYLYKIYYSNSFEKECSELIKYYPTVENYFYCGSLFENRADTKNALYYYSTWVEKFPDIWSNDSKFYENILVKNFASKKRILSPKYSRIQEILDYIKTHSWKDI